MILKIAIESREMHRKLSIRTTGQGLLDITEQIVEIVSDSGQAEGLCTLFIQHTSASLVIQENADPSARYDLERWMNRLVPEHDPLYTHTAEGPDDMPSHLKASLTASHLSIPILNGELTLGTWQTIYLWEHRRQGSIRNLVVHIG